MSKKRARAAATTLMTNLDRHGFNPNAGSRHQGKREIAGFLEQQQGSYIGVSKGQGMCVSRRYSRTRGSLVQLTEVWPAAVL